MKGTGEKEKETRVLASGGGRSRSSGAVATRGGQVIGFKRSYGVSKGRKGCMEGFGGVGVIGDILEAGSGWSWVL